MYQSLEAAAIQEYDDLAEHVVGICEDPIKKKDLQKYQLSLYYDATEHAIQIRDADKQVQQSLDPRELRLSCKCAGCIHELTGEKLLRPERVATNVKPKTLTARGQYAVSITWSDGHQSSMYPWSQLLASPVKK